jgi:hypothetical protein
MSVCTNCGGENPRWRETATGAHRCLPCLLDNGKGKAHVLIPCGDLPEIDTDCDEEPTLPDDQGEDDDTDARAVSKRWAEATADEMQEDLDRMILDEIEEAGDGFDPFFAWDEIALSLQITGDEAEAITCALEAGREQARKLMAVIRRYNVLDAAERASA